MIGLIVVLGGAETKFGKEGYRGRVNPYTEGLSSESVDAFGSLLMAVVSKNMSRSLPIG